MIGMGLSAVLLLLAFLTNTTSLGDSVWFQIFLGKSALNFTLRASIPLILGALGGILCERSGVINIGIEGMMLTGAFSAFVAKVATAALPLELSLAFATLSALLMGGLLALLHAGLCIRYRVDQIISGVVIIILATGLTTYLFDPSVSSRGKLGTLALPLLSDIPFFGDLFFNNGLITYAALALVVFLHFMLFRTRWGLRTRAVGEHPKAADTVGISVNAMRYRNVVLGGMVAGLAGAFLVLEAVGQFKEGMTAGRGFISLAAMIFGNWTPFGAMGASVLFGYTQALQNELLLAGFTAVPRHFVSMLPYATTLVVLAGFVGHSRAPAALGKPYTKE